MMRTTRLLALGLLLTLAATGCGKTPAGDRIASAGGTPAASASEAAAGDEGTPLKFAQCMREQGLSWFPDPEPDGGLRIKVPAGTDPATMDAAQEACRKWSPEGGERAPADPEMLAQARRMAQCMRDNGVPDFPDPQPDGGIRLERGRSGAGPGDPAFDKADRLCSKFRPQGRAEGRGTSEG
jgi:hypothetical protein